MVLKKPENEQVFLYGLTVFLVDGRIEVRAEDNGELTRMQGAAIISGLASEAARLANRLVVSYEGFAIVDPLDPPDSDNGGLYATETESS